MGKEMYINGQRYYDKPLIRMSDEKISGKDVIFYKDRNNYNYVTGFVIDKMVYKLPKETDSKTLSSIFEIDGYGYITNKNVKYVLTEKTKQVVIDIVKQNLKIESFGEVNKNNIKNILNNIIKKLGHNYPNYASGFDTKPSSSNSKYNNYKAFLPTTSGDEPYFFQEELNDLKFKGYSIDSWDMPYYYVMEHKKSGIIVSLTEGDVYLKIPKNK